MNFSLYYFPQIVNIYKILHRCKVPGIFSASVGGQREEGGSENECKSRLV